MPSQLIWLTKRTGNIICSFRFKEKVPNASVSYLADHIGHYPQVEAPDAVLNAYFTFLEGTASQS
jgi:pimeloyl-ACP methyl ester carboxylesterase